MSNTQTDAPPPPMDDMGNGSGSAPDTVPLGRSYTHADLACIRQILLMGKDDKRLENATIEIRNKQRDKRRKAVTPHSFTTVVTLSQKPLGSIRHPLELHLT